MTLHEGPLEQIVADHLLRTLFVLFSVCRLFLELCEASELICNCVEELSLLFEEMHLHPPSDCVIASFHDLFLVLCLRMQLVKKVGLLLACILLDDRSCHSEPLLLQCFHAIGIFYLEEGVIQESLLLRVFGVVWVAVHPIVRLVRLDLVIFFLLRLLNPI